MALPLKGTSTTFQLGLELLIIVPVLQLDIPDVRTQLQMLIYIFPLSFKNIKSTCHVRLEYQRFQSNRPHAMRNAPFRRITRVIEIKLGDIRIKFKLFL